MCDLWKIFFTFGCMRPEGDSVLLPLDVQSVEVKGRSPNNFFSRNASQD